MPYDVWCVVVACLDPPTLKSISVVNRDYHHEASKYLWKKCTLFIDSRFHGVWARRYLEDGCNIIMKPERASRIQDLCIDIQASLGPEHDPAVERVFQMVFAVLQRTKNLKSLTIKAAHYRSRISRALSILPFPFHLDRFATDLFCDENLHGFWAAHPNIKHIELLGVDTDVPNLPAPLASLHTVRATLAQQSVVVRGSPVTSVHLDGFWQGECRVIRDHLAASTAPSGILDLSMQIFDDSVTSTPYIDIITHLPRLRTLRVIHADIPDRDHKVAVMEALASLQDLEVFEWGGGSPAGQADIFAACSKRCRSLRRITFRWGNGSYFQRRFERESEEAGWGIVQG